MTAPQALPALLAHQARQVQEYLVQRVPLVQGPVVQRVQRVLVLRVPLEPQAQELAEPRGPLVPLVQELRELLGPPGLVLMEQQVPQVLA